MSAEPDQCPRGAAEHARQIENFGLCPEHPEETILPASHPEEDPGPEYPPFDPFMAAIFTAQANNAAAASNAVIDNLEARLKEWQERYLWLFNEVRAANKIVDSVRIQGVLWDHDVWAQAAREQVQKAVI